MNPELAKWFRETFIERQGYCFGPYEIYLDEHEQICGWACFGCNAQATTSWPKWGNPDMKHEPDCKYLGLMKSLEQP